MPDPDIAGHHGDKNTQADGRVHRQGGEGASTTQDFREEENCNYSVCEPLPSMWLAMPSLNTHSEMRVTQQSDLAGTCKCKDNHT